VSLARPTELIEPSRTIPRPFIQNTIGTSREDKYHWKLA
jgi:hypothetical protein